MKKFVTAFVLCAGLGACAMAHAGSRAIAYNDDDIMYRDGIATYSYNNGTVATSWFSTKSRFSNGDDTRVLIQIHCSSGLIRNVRSIEYSYNRVVSDTGENWNTKWRNPIPGSLESFFEQACRVQ